MRLWNVLTLPAAFLLVVGGVGMLYWLAPNTTHEFRWVTPGALLFATGWIVASLLMALYLSRFGSYNRTYGSLGAVIVLMVWLYWTNMMLLVGGELNSVLAKKHDTAYKRRNPAAPAAGSKPSLSRGNASSGSSEHRNCRDPERRDHVTYVGITDDQPAAASGYAPGQSPVSSYSHFAWTSRHSVQIRPTGR